MLAVPTILAAAATQGSWDPTLVVVLVAQMISVAAATPAPLAQVVEVRISPDAHAYHCERSKKKGLHSLASI